MTIKRNGIIVTPSKNNDGAILSLYLYGQIYKLTALGGKGRDKLSRQALWNGKFSGENI